MVRSARMSQKTIGNAIAWVYFFTPPKGVGRVIYVLTQSKGQTEVLNEVSVGNKVSEFCHLAMVIPVGNQIFPKNAQEMCIVNFLEDVVEENRVSDSLFEKLKLDDKNTTNTAHDDADEDENEILSEQVYMALTGLGFNKKKVREYVQNIEMDGPVEKIVTTGIKHFAQRGA